MKKARKAVVSFMCIALALVFSIFAYADSAEHDESTIRDGVRINSVDVSGMTAEEATTKVKAYVKKITQVPVELTVSDIVVETTMKELGYKWSNKSVIEEAVGVGKSGNIIKRYKDDLDLKNEGIELELELSIDEETLKTNLQTVCAEHNVEAKNATLKLTDAGFEITPEQNGVEIDYDVTVKGLYTYITEEWDGESTVKYTAKTQVSSPKYTTEDCEKVSAIPMGTFSTTFATGSSYSNRNMNIKNGADKINDVVLYPGEQYSLNEHLAPWTADNGWYPAGTYVDGGVADSYGGGICQVSSTLYNALLLAEIDIVERYSHSMAVAYVDLAADAALAGDYKDLVFENNTDAPIYVQSIYSEAGKITFNIYGHDTRDEGHSVEYISKTIKTTPIKEKVTKDKTKPKGYEEVTDNGHTGYVAELWKVTYQDGVETDRELLHKSSYAMSPKKIIKGTGKKTKDSKDDKKSTKNKSEEETTKKKNTTTTEETTTAATAAETETTTVATETTANQ